MVWPLLLLLAFATCTVHAVPVCVAGNRLAWISLGDWGNPVGALQQVVNQMGIEASSTDASFLTLTGDNFYRRGVNSSEDPQWKSTYEAVFNPTTLSAITHYAVLGNHDYRGNAQAQVEYSSKTASRFVMPARWYAKEYTFDCMGDSPQNSPGSTALFLFVDTMVLAGLVGATVEKEKEPLSLRPEHWSWLQDQLQNATADWIFLVGHYPVLSAGKHGDMPALVSQLLPMMEFYGVDAYFSSHDHNEQLLVSAFGSPLFVVSGTASSISSPIDQNHPRLLWGDVFFGFASMEINTTHLTIKYVSDSGEVRYKYVTTRTAKDNRGLSTQSFSSLSVHAHKTEQLASGVIIAQNLLEVTFSGESVKSSVARHGSKVKNLMRRRRRSDHAGSKIEVKEG